MRIYKDFTSYGVSPDEMEDFNNKKGSFMIYAICAVKDSHNMFEILSTKELFSGKDKYGDYGVIALTCTRSLAIDTVYELISLWYREKGDFKGIREYYYNNSL